MFLAFLRFPAFPIFPKTSGDESTGGWRTGCD